LHEDALAFERGRDLLKRGRFFDPHEASERLWPRAHGARRLFIQGHPDRRRLSQGWPASRRTGRSYLSGRRPSDAWENATSTTWASVGILVESWAVGGGAYHLDWDQPVVVASYSETNPTKSWRDFGGSATVSDGLSARIFASSSRRYRIWVYCWAEVQAQMLVSAGAYASTSIDCWMPYLVVEQTKV
jgi:hypothetical protein